MSIDLGRPVGVSKFGRVGHIAALREFHMDRVDAAFGTAVMARRTAALETAVDDMAVAARRANASDAAFELGCRGSAAVVAEVELRQSAVEPARDMAANRMGVGEDALAGGPFQGVEPA